MNEEAAQRQRGTAEVAKFEGRAIMVPQISVMPILVVDDFETMAKAVAGLLRKLGFMSVDIALNGSNALKNLRRKSYDLVISDWNMEPMSGYDLLREIRADSHLASIPVILITGEARAQNVLAARAAGVNGYIIKPFNAERLKQVIDSVMFEMSVHHEADALVLDPDAGPLQPAMRRLLV